MTQIFDTEPARAQEAAEFDLDALLSGAVRLRPDRAAIADAASETEPLSFAELDRRVSALAGFWLDLGLKRGECILVAAGATATSVVAFLAALRAGLDVALAPLHLGGEDMVDFAGDCAAVALAAGAAYGELAPAEELLSVASQAPHVRLVCSLGGGSIDGAVDADPGKLAVSAPVNNAARRREPRILTRTQSGEIIVHRPRTLIAAALNLVTRARIGMRLPIVTTVAPVSFAGLVAGPVAALIAGAPLLLHGPFDASGFLTLLHRTGTAHLVVPTAFLPALHGASLLAPETLASLILLSRHNDLEEAESLFVPATGSCSVPIVDLFAIGEHAAVPEPREVQGSRAPLTEPHYILLDDRRILAVGRGANSTLEGAAVTDCEAQRAAIA